MALSAGTKKAFQPTEAQARAIECIQAPMAVDAAAGSGKTAVLIRRILRIVGDDWARLGNILAITFTEKAAGELRAKLRPHVPAEERFRLDQAWIGTFHSFCARLLRRYGPAIYLDPSFRLLDEHQAGLILRKSVNETLVQLLDARNASAASLVEDVGFAPAVGALEELMQFRWHARRAIAEREGADAWESAVLNALEVVYDHVQRAFLARLDALGALDFQELEIRALKLLGDQTVATSCRATFAHILVDEYQDTNDVQTELVLKLFEPPVNHLFIVGDEAQSIYRFRGANVSCFARVRGIIEGMRGETVRLAHNFRSRKSIIDFVNLSQEVLADGLFSDSTSRKPIEAAKSDRAGAAVFELEVVASEDMKADAMREREARAIATVIEEQVRSGAWSYGDIVLLFRAMSSAEIYESALRRRLIPCASVGGRGFLKRTEVTDLIAALNFAANRDDTAARLALLRSPIGGVSDDDLVLMAGEDGRGLCAAVEKDERLALINELPEMAAHMRPSEILRRVINEAGLELLWSGLDRSGAALANMDRLVAIAKDLERELPTTLSDFTSFMREMRERGAKFGDIPPESCGGGSVRLMTVHAAKGLEFPVVFLPDLLRTSPPANKQWMFSRGDAGSASGIVFRKRDPAKPFGSRLKTERFARLSEEEAQRDDMESKRLLYVAMTRAVDALVIPTHEGVKDGGSWHGWLRATLATKGGQTISTRISPIPDAAGNDGERGLSDVQAFNVGARPANSGALRLSVSQLDSYSVCPLQYYLKYVLGLPASEVTRDDAGRIEPNVYGSIVHAMLARATEDEEELVSAARSESLASGVHTGDKLMEKLLCDVKTAITLVDKENIGTGFRELPFEIRAGTSAISGTIDWLKPVPGGYDIVDYKTGTEKASALKAKTEHYEMQMQAYALAAESITGAEVMATRLVFPSAGKVLSRKMDSARREAARNNIERVARGIENCDYEIKTKPPCEGCIFHRNAMCWEDRCRAQGLGRKAKGQARAKPYNSQKTK
jgi:ATP-dependent helicase/nuclease subunit A